MKIPDLEGAQALATAGMLKALAHAESEMLEVLGGDVRWQDLAYAFLVRFCRQRALPFVSEDVSEASKTWGMIQPPTDRAWGRIYVRAARAGIIRRAGIGKSRRRHGSICPLWQSQIYRGS